MAEGITQGRAREHFRQKEGVRRCGSHHSNQSTVEQREAGGGRESTENPFEPSFFESEDTVKADDGEILLCQSVSTSLFVADGRTDFRGARGINSARVKGGMMGTRPAVSGGPIKSASNAA